MNPDAFNMSIRKFLKMVGVQSQREIETAVERAVASGKLKGNEALSAKMTLTIDGAALDVSFDGKITLE
jgi:ribosomal protein L1